MNLTNSKQLRIAIFVIIAITLCFYFPKNFAKAQGAQHALDCDSFYASDVVGCGKLKAPFKSYPDPEKIGSVADLYAKAQPFTNGCGPANSSQPELVQSRRHHRQPDRT